MDSSRVTDIVNSTRPFLPLIKNVAESNLNDEDTFVGKVDGKTRSMFRRVSRIISVHLR